MLVGGVEVAVVEVEVVAVGQIVVDVHSPPGDDVAAATLNSKFRARPSPLDDPPKNMNQPRARVTTAIISFCMLFITYN